MFMYHILICNKLSTSKCMLFHIPIHPYVKETYLLLCTYMVKNKLNKLWMCLLSVQQRPQWQGTVKLKTDFFKGVTYFISWYKTIIQRQSSLCFYTDIYREFPQL